MKNKLQKRKYLLDGMPVKVVGFNYLGFPLVKRGKSILKVDRCDLEPVK